MLDYYDQLKKSEHFTYKELRDLQFMKLRALCKNFGIEINSWKDFYGLPLTSKEQLRNYIPKVPSYGLSQTSGRTGEPFRFATPLERRAINKATELRNWEWLGWRGQFSVRLTTGEPSRWMKLYNHFLHIALRNSRTVNPSYVRLIRKRPFIIHGVPSAIRELVWFSQKEKIGRSEAKCVVFGEDLSEHMSVLSDFFSGVYQSYGLSECVNVAFECQYHSLHVNMENCIVEEVDNEIVITNLNNYVTPFIRYRTGDRGHVKRSNCKCGRKFDIITGLQGRKVDFYASEDLKRPLGWWLASSLGHKYYKFFRKYKIEFSPKSKTITVYIIPKVSIDEAKRGLSSYLYWVKKETGVRDVLLQFVDEIPTRSKPFEVIE